MSCVDPTTPGGVNFPYQSLIMTTTAMLTATAFMSAIGLWFFMKKRSNNNNIDSKKRSMSFSSMTMIRGSFPPSCQVAEPIMNILTIFRKLPKEKETKEAFQQLFDLYRFRAIPIFSNETQQWEFHEISQPNIDNHFRTVSLATESLCYEYIEKITRTTFEQEQMIGKQPLWCIHRIVNESTGMSFLLLRIHHVIGDGIALVLAIDRVFTDLNGEKVKTVLPGGKYDLQQKTPSSPSPSSTNKAPKEKDSVVSQLFRLLSAFFRVITLATSPYDSDLLFTSQDKPHLTMSLQNETIVYLPIVSLDYVKQLKNKAKATINDIMLGAMTGAIRRYCERLNDPLLQSSSLQMRALLPISFPRPEEELNDPNRCLRNLWCFMSAPMAINETTPQGRVTVTMAMMEGLKRSYEAIVQFWLMNSILCYSPLFVIHDTAQKTFTRHSLVFSNVPGPQEALYLCGEELVSFQAIFPNILPQTIIVSYNGTICGNLVVDSRIVKDPEVLRETYLEELRELGRVYGVDNTEMVRELK
jgi:hypothetical protein